ncbi:MAG: serine/threonine protein kinase [Myxococcales bacterium]|nr:serine/threonine protein kinase [Myxococcales bacterium]
MHSGGFIGPYRLEESIGEGSMGTVWTARHPTLDRKVAIKLIRSEVQSNPRAREAFLREVRALSRLHGPQIVQVMDFGFTDGGDPYMVTEFLEGEDLLARLQRTGPLPAREAVAIGVEVLEALAEAHAMGVVHRDLKPGNIFLQRVAGGARTAVKVLDFGIAKLISGDEGEETVWPGARLKGSPRYMSPEQVEGGAITPATDIYAFGATLYRVLTGEPVFGGPRDGVLAAHVGRAVEPMGERAPLLGIPPELDELVLACLAKDPAARPQSAAALHGRLVRLRAALEVGPGAGLALGAGGREPSVLDEVGLYVEPTPGGGADEAPLRSPAPVEPGAGGRGAEPAGSRRRRSGRGAGAGRVVGG